MPSLVLRPLKASDFQQISLLADAVFGTDYISIEELQRQWPLLQNHNHQASFVIVAEEGSQIFGFRITYMPGTWLSEKEGKKSLIESYNVPVETIAYFKTVVVTEPLRGQGWGRKLANASIDALKNVGSRAIITHSWNESPNASSASYLRALGFRATGAIAGFWSKDDYQCLVCNQFPCTCSATEMFLAL